MKQQAHERTGTRTSSDLFTTLAVHRAQVLAGQVVPPIVIRIDEEFPRDLSRNRAMHLHVTEAGELASALVKSLPGGTLDALLRELLLIRASQLVVTF